MFIIIVLIIIIIIIIILLSRSESSSTAHHRHDLTSSLRSIFVVTHHSSTISMSAGCRMHSRIHTPSSSSIISVAAQWAHSNTTHRSTADSYAAHGSMMIINSITRFAHKQTACSHVRINCPKTLLCCWEDGWLFWNTHSLRNRESGLK